MTEAGPQGAMLIHVSKPFSRGVLQIRLVSRSKWLTARKSAVSRSAQVFWRDEMVMDQANTTLKSIFWPIPLARNSESRHTSRTADPLSVS